MQLTPTDHTQLVQILANQPDFANPTHRWGYLHSAFVGSPRANDIMAQLDTSGNPKIAASHTVSRLLAFGQDQPGREVLTLLVQHLASDIGYGDEYTFLQGLLTRYPIEHSIVAPALAPAPANPAPALPPDIVVREAMLDGLSASEVETIIFDIGHDLGVRNGQLPMSTLDERVLALLLHCRKRKNLGVLVAHLRQEYPHLNL